MLFFAAKLQKCFVDGTGVSRYWLNFHFSVNYSFNTFADCFVCVRHELTEVLGQLPAPVSTHHSLVIHVALVSYQQHLGVVPRVCLNLSRPGNQHTQQSERRTQRPWSQCNSKCPQAGRILLFSLSAYSKKIHNVVKPNSCSVTEHSYKLLSWKTKPTVHATFISNLRSEFDRKQILPYIQYIY